MVVPEPPNINNWLIWGNLAESVMIDFKLNVWDKGEQEFFLEVIHRPTELMKYVHQITNKEKDYDNARDAFVSRFPMDMVGLVESRTKGTYILMLCDWRGNDTKLIEMIDKTKLEENKRLRTEIDALSSLLVRTQARMVQLAKHPEPLQKELINQARELKKVTGPAVVSGQPMTPQGEEEDNK